MRLIDLFLLGRPLRFDGEREREYWGYISSLLHLAETRLLVALDVAVCERRVLLYVLPRDLRQDTTS